MEIKNFAILLEDNNRKTICRQCINRMKKFLVLLNEAKREQSKGRKFSAFTATASTTSSPMRMG